MPRWRPSSPRRTAQPWADLAAAALARFSPATRAWFEGAFAAPTPAQAGAWEAISAGRHALVVAPTGSGKTLSAFLWSLDRLAAEAPPADPRARCRVAYVSPLKALAVDVERNLRAPLIGLRQASVRLGIPEPDVVVGTRTGDTPADERRRFTTRPPDILITTPESLFLLLTSRARESLRHVETVIVDEVHAVAATKRGAHLALTLERLDALLERPAQRVGLSATVRPVAEVARFLGGAAEVTVVQPAAAKTIDLSVVVPVADMSELGTPTGEFAGSAAGAEPRASIWPHVEERILDLVEDHRSTIVFANSRRLAERLCARLNEVATDRAYPDEPLEPTSSGRTPLARRVDGPGRLHPGLGRVAPRRGDRPRAPRLGVQGAARPDRGGAQGRPAARGGRHQQPGARHRHGRGRSRRPGRVPALGGRRTAARRAGRTPGGSRLARCHLPEVPRRPRPDRGRGGAHGGRDDRRAALPAQPARRPGPTDHRDGGDGRVGGR